MTAMTPNFIFPEDLLSQALAADSPTQLHAALALARTLYTEESGDASYASFLSTTVHDIVGKPSLALLTHLLDVEHVPVSRVRAADVAQRPSAPLVDALVTRGWDVNTPDPANRVYYARRLIDYVVGPCHNEALARWLVVEKGARIIHASNASNDSGGNYDDDDDPDYDPDYVERPIPIPILESCVQYGSVALFQFLRDRGARLTRRLLHQAVLCAAQRGADPGRVGGDRGDPGDPGEPGEPGDRGDVHVEEPAAAAAAAAGSDEAEEEEKEKARRKKNSAEMLCFLVDQVGLDVNALDSARDHRLNQWGTPVCYAATAKLGAPVVKWLLAKGADPAVPGPYTGFDAWGLARLKQCDEVLAVLDAWKMSKGDNT